MADIELKIGINWGLSGGPSLSKVEVFSAQSYGETTNSQNSDDKVKKLTLDSHSVFVSYCNILTYFHVMNNK